MRVREHSPPSELTGGNLSRVQWRVQSIPVKKATTSKNQTKSGRLVGESRRFPRFSANTGLYSQVGTIPNFINSPHPSLPPAPARFGGNPLPGGEIAKTLAQRLIPRLRVQQVRSSKWKSPDGGLLLLVLLLQ